MSENDTTPSLSPAENESFNIHPTPECARGIPPVGVTRLCGWLCLSWLACTKRDRLCRCRRCTSGSRKSRWSLGACLSINLTCDRGQHAREGGAPPTSNASSNTSSWKPHSTSIDRQLFSTALFMVCSSGGVRSSKSATTNAPRQRQAGDASIVCTDRSCARAPRQQPPPLLGERRPCDLRHVSAGRG